MVAQLLEALRYKQEGRGFDALEFFLDKILSGRSMALGSTQPLTQMSTRNISWWVKAAGV